MPVYMSVYILYTISRNDYYSLILHKCESKFAWCDILTIWLKHTILLTCFKVVMVFHIFTYSSKAIKPVKVQNIKTFPSNESNDHPTSLKICRLVIKSISTTSQSPGSWPLRNINNKENNYLIGLLAPTFLNGKFKAYF